MVAASLFDTRDHVARMRKEKPATRAGFFWKTLDPGFRRMTSR
jgi:hypothetical protein